jgi:hypothetical protein
VLECGGAYIEPGATAIDDEDGDISAYIVIDSSAVNMNEEGSYEVTYNVSDSSGNAAVQVVRTVQVVDRIPPHAEMTVPSHGASNVVVNTSIVVQVTDSGSGVNISTIAIDVREDGNSVSGTVDISGTPSSFIATFDPNAPLGNLKPISVTVSASDLANTPTNGNASTHTFSFLTAPASGSPWDIADDDGDGIENSEEDLLGTSRTTKTMFVRPMKKDVATGAWVYWSEFVGVLFPHASKAGFADILAFSDADIEVVVIGGQTPYLPMREFSIRSS